MSDIIRNQRPRISRPVIYGAAVLSVGGAVWWAARRRANAVTADAGTDPGTDPGYDPNAGYDTGGFGDYSPAPDGGPYGTTPGIEPSMPTPPRTNAEWTRQAVDYLTGQGFNPATSAVALGVYLAGRGLSPHQRDIVTAAIGGVGYPPTRPAPPHVTPQHPDVKGAPHLAITDTTKTVVKIRWTTVKGATHYRVERGNGVVVKDVIGNTATITRPSKNDETIHVTAYRYARRYSQSSNAVVIPTVQKGHK